jgi:hypothetical protein
MHAPDSVALRFVALTLPPYEPLMPVRSESRRCPRRRASGRRGARCPSRCRRRSSCSPPTSRRSLSAQILDTLRYRRPMSSAILDLVQFHMARVGRNLIEFSVPLHFVSPDGLAMFPSQLTSTFYLALRKFGDVYCVVEPRIDGADVEAAPRGAGARVTTPSPPPLAETPSARTSLQSVQRKRARTSRRSRSWAVTTTSCRCRR